MASPAPGRPAASNRTPVSPDGRLVDHAPALQPQKQHLDAMKLDPNAPLYPVAGMPDPDDEPRDASSRYLPPSRGITIRQHFAGLAMQGALASDPAWTNHHDLANHAVDCADALIARLNDTPPPPRFTDAQVQEWMDCHGFRGSESAARCAMEDAQSLHLVTA
jgi:hypothetical protein